MSYTATYISANSFSVPNDKREFFVATARVMVDCNGTLKYSSITSSSFADGITTVVLTQSVLTDPCGDCFVFPFFSGPTGNMPIHTHEDDDTGGSGVVGSPAQYEWNDTQIRFKNTDGSWGDWVELGGDAGSVWRVGNGTPSNGLGIDGDYYLDLGEVS
jgi:hypothetical protein